MAYVLGLDIGSTSVGWAVINLDKHRIEDLNAHCFNAAEIPKTREPLAKPRREARSARRRVDRKRGRLRRAREMFVRYGLIGEGRPDEMFSEHPSAPAPDPWSLRAEGLDRELSGEEFSRALYHIAKHRGFKSNAKHEQPREDREKKQEAKKMLDGTAGMRRMLSECGKRTVGEMMYCHESFRDRKRNRAGDYSHTTERTMLADEVRKIFQAQREHGNVNASCQFEEEFLAEAFNWQKPFASGDDIIKRVGTCTFETEEKRAPRASWTAERFNLLCKINNLRIDGQPLSEDQRRSIEEMAYEPREVTYRQIRKRLNMPDEARFGGCSLNYGTTRRGKPVDPMDCEKSRFFSLSAYQKLKDALSPTGCWDAVKDNEDLLNDLAFVLTFYKNENEIRSQLTSRSVAPAIVEVLCGQDAPSFTGVGKMSIRAMRHVIPHLEKGLRYDEACEAAGYCHYDTGGKLIEPDRITNPVVFRALTRARKVVNNVVALYGPPTYVNIELARDIGKSAEERDKIDQMNRENERARKDDEAHFREFFAGAEFNWENRTRWRLYHEQASQCPYCQQGLDLERLLEPGYVEIDHILPRSQSLDNRMSNLILVHCNENRDKGNRIPHEYLVGNPRRLAAFEAWVETTYKHNRYKRLNLLRESFDPRQQEECRQHHLNDTRYAAKFFADFLRHNLEFADPGVKQPVRCLAGGITATARGLWGLGRTRQEKADLADDLHHALDAAVIAALTPARIKFITDYWQARETGRVTEVVDEETGEVYEVFRDKPFAFPPPWKAFRKELLAWLSDNPPKEIRDLGLPSYDDMPKALDRLKNRVAPRVLVSRMPRRKIRGAIHADTIRSAKRLQDGISIARVALTSLELADIPNLYDWEHNQKLYQRIQEEMEAAAGAIRERMAGRSDKEIKTALKKVGQEAFGSPDKPLRKPMDKERTKDNREASIVRRVKVCKPQKGGVKVRKGIADNTNESAVRVDVFHGADGYYLVPVYVSHVMEKRLPDRAMLAHKPESIWPMMDDSYEFLFSLYQYDMVRIVARGTDFLGYYRGPHRDNGALVVCPANNAKVTSGVCVKTAKLLEKYEMGVLGDYHLVGREVRRGLADDSDLEAGEVED